MSELFLITGLPRSGTAFMSQLCNLSDRVICLHEGVVDYEEPFKYLSDRSEYYAGDSSSFGILPKFDSVDCKRVLIERDYSDVIKSYSSYTGIDIDEISKLIKELESIKVDFKSKFFPFVVRYEELFDIETLRKIWTFLFPDLYFPEKKVENLTRIRCNRKPPSQAEIESMKPILKQRLWLGL